jgi:allantoin racemase
VAAGVDVGLMRVAAPASSTPRPAATPAPRVLVINPNTNPAVTQRVRDAAAGFASAAVGVDVVNPPRGPFSIETAAERAEAEREALALIARADGQGYAAYVLACFDDLALDAARALVDVPVIGTCEAGIAATRALSPRFAIVTTFDAAVPGIRALMQRHGAGPQATVRAAGIGVAAAADAGQGTMQRIVACARAAIDQDGAQALLLASGGLTGLGPALAAAVDCPVVDGVAAAISAAVERVARAGR